MDPGFVSKILGRRNFANGGSEVIYDLSEGIDFSGYRDVADALSEVVVRMEGPSWYTREVDGTHEFHPVHKVVVMVPGERRRSVARMVIRFTMKSVEKSLAGVYLESQGGSPRGQAGYPRELGDDMANVLRELQAEGRFSRKALRNMATDIRRSVEFRAPGA